MPTQRKRGDRFPLLRYPGSKGTKAPLLAALLPDFNEYREVFAGSAAMLPFIPTTARRWINDISPHVSGFHRFVRDHPRAVSKINALVRQTTADEVAKRRRFALAAKRFDKGIVDPLGYLLLTRHAYSAIVTRRRPEVASYQRYCGGNGHRIFTTPKNGIHNIAPSRVGFWRQLMQGVEITSDDYERVLFAPGENVALMLDPPYVIRDHASPIYDYPFTDEDHLRLFRLLRDCPHRFLMTIHRSGLTLDLYCSRNFRTPFRRRKGFRVLRSSYSYTIAHQTLNVKATELIVCNYDPDL
jgi:DNA adenine methylase